MRSRRGFVLVPAVVVAVLLVVVFLRQPLGRFVLGRVLNSLGRTFNGTVTYGSISGDVFAHPRLANLRIVGAGDSLKVDSLDLRYNLPGMLRGRFAFTDVRVVRPRVYIGTRRGPAPAAATAAPSRLRFPTASVRRFSLTGGEVYLDTVRRLDSVNLELGLRSRPDRLSASLGSAAARLVQERVAVRRLSAECQVTPDSLELVALDVATDHSRAHANMRLAFRDGSISAAIESLSVSLPEFTDLPGRVFVKGSGAMRGTSRSAQVDYQASGLAWREIAFPTISGRLAFKDRDFQFTAAGRDSNLGGVRADVKLSLADSSYSGRVELTGVALRRVDRTLPDIRADVAADLAGRGLDSVAGTMRARLAELGIDSVFASGSYVRGRAVVESLGLSGPVGSLSGHGSWSGNRFALDCRADSLDGAALEQFAGVEARGRLSGRLAAAGTLDTFDARGALRFRNLKFGGTSVDGGSSQFQLAWGRALHGRLSVSAGPVWTGSMKVDSLHLDLADSDFVVALGAGGTAVRARGRAAVARAGLDVAVESLRVTTPLETVAVSRPLALALRRDSLHVQGAASGIAGSEARYDVVTGGGRPVRGSVSVRHLDIKRLTELLHLKLDATGTVDLDASSADTMQLALAVTDLMMPSYGVALRRVEAAMRATRTGADVERLSLIHIDSTGTVDTSSVSGRVGYALDGGFRLDSSSLRVQLHDPGHWVLFFLKPSLVLERGQVFGDVMLTGNLATPTMQGRVRIAQARLAAPPLNTVFDRVNAELVFDRGRINIEKLTGRSAHGTVVVTGFVDLGRGWQVDSLRFASQFTGTTFNPEPDIYAVAGGNAAVDWAPGRPISITGTADVSEALLTMGFGQSGAPSGGFDTTVVYDVHVRGDRGIWLRNDLLDVEFSGDLNVRKTVRDMTYSGELDLRQGTVYYLDHTLRVTSATARFENINAVNPDIDITAEMPVHGVSAQNGASLPDKIILTVSGTLEKPTFTFRSEPPGWTEIEIASYMNLNLTPDQLSVLEQKNAVSKLLSERLLGYFQTQVSKRARGLVKLDYLSFESGILGGENTKVTVGKYVGRNLYVSYTQNFTGSMQPAFQVEYYIDRRNELLAGLSEEGTYSVRYRLKLRY